MTVVEQEGSLQFTFDDGTGETRRESIRGIKPAAADQDVYDCGVAISGLIADATVGLRRSSLKDYEA